MANAGNRQRNVGENDPVARVIGLVAATLVVTSVCCLVVAVVLVSVTLLLRLIM